jgi:ATP-dependent NAD(P)H-hydrate dehydratase
MVHPYMRQASHLGADETADSVADNVLSMLSRVHVLVIGPGLGREKLMQDTSARLLDAARQQNIPVVLDADGLQLAQQRPELVRGWREVILTPNVVEFGRLAKSQGVEVAPEALGTPGACERLAEALGGVTIVAKGAIDCISNGAVTLTSEARGGLKRSGGQGDTLTGSLATMLAWRRAYHDRLWDHENDLDPTETLALAAFAGSAITRECSRLAFEEFGRSLQAGDLTGKVHQAFLNVIGEKTKL